MHSCFLCTPVSSDLLQCLASRWWQVHGAERTPWRHPRSPLRREPLLSPSSPLPGQQVPNTHQSPQQTLLRPSRCLLIIGKEPILIDQTFETSLDHELSNADKQPLPDCANLHASEFWERSYLIYLVTVSCLVPSSDGYLACVVDSQVH